MTIKEVEELLGTNRANIRYYEKEGLFTAERKANGYRDYTQENVNALKKIILFRKMGISIDNIHLLMDGCITLEEAISETLISLEEQQKQLDGAIAICREMEKQRPSMEQLDVSYYEDFVTEQKNLGLKFMDFCNDYLVYEKKVLEERYIGEQDTEGDEGTVAKLVKKILFNSVACGLLWMALGSIEGKNLLGSGAKGLIFAMGLILINAVLRIPYYVYMRGMGGKKIKYPNLVELLLEILTIMLAISFGNLLF